jgi:hypothetical protein
MVKRRALIIGNPGETGAQNYCEGVNHDLRNYSAFLVQPLGGAWETSEISVLLRPTVSQVKNALGEVKSGDYAIVIFAGHGHYSEARRSTILELRRGKEIDSMELRTGPSKQTLVLDCCRKIAQEQVQKRLVEAMDRKALVLNRGDCRKYYDIQIERCPTGIAVMWGCSVGETAGDDPQNGGYYSSGLLECAIDWAKNSSVNPSTSVARLSIVESHDTAVASVRQRTGGRQNPSMEKPRSEPYFPFAIIA